MATGERRPEVSLLNGSLCHASKITLFLLIFAVIDPFGCAQWSGRRSHELWQTLYAPFYQSASGSARDDITVLLIDDAVQAAAKRKRPFDSYDVMQIIDDIVRAPGPGKMPQAIFLDIPLGNAAPPGGTQSPLVAGLDRIAGSPEARDCDDQVADRLPSKFRCLLIKIAQITSYANWSNKRRCTMGRLIEKLKCMSAAGGTPILFARPDETSINDDQKAVYAALDTIAATVPVRVDKGYPLAFPDPSQPLSPAAALFGIHCLATDCEKASPIREERLASQPISQDSERISWDDANYGTSIDVVWGVPHAGDYSALRQDLEGVGKARGTKCADGSPNCDAKTSDAATSAPQMKCAFANNSFFDLARRFERIAIAGFNFSPMNYCEYSETLSYDMLNTITQIDAQRFIGNRLILVGVNSDPNDMIAAAPYGAVSGIYYHAMALDNLIQRGSSYPKIAAPVFRRLGLTWSDVANVVAVFLTAFPLALITRMLERRDATRLGKPPTMVEWAHRLAILAAAGVGALVVVFAISGGRALIPENFNIAAIAFVLAIGLLDLGDVVLEPWFVRIAAWLPVVGRLIGWKRRYAPRSAKADWHERS